MVEKTREHKVRRIGVRKQVVFKLCTEGTATSWPPKWDYQTPDQEPGGWDLSILGNSWRPSTYLPKSEIPLLPNCLLGYSTNKSDAGDRSIRVVCCEVM